MADDLYDVSSVNASRVSKDGDAALGAHMLTSSVDSEPGEARPDWSRTWVEKATTTRLSGECTTWNKKGWGFIKRDDGSSDVFIHQRSINQRGFRSLREGAPSHTTLSLPTTLATLTTCYAT